MYADDTSNLTLANDLDYIGFRIQSLKEGDFVLEPKGDLSPEAWPLAWALTQGKVRLIKPGAGQESPQDADEIEGLANSILKRALRFKASDIHLEPEENHLGLRLRIDGHLRRQTGVPATHKNHLVAHLKIRAGMDIAEKRRAQDGRIQMKFEGRSVDFRVSTLPTRFGEKMVLRILDKSGVAPELNGLGMPDDVLSAVNLAIQAPYGLMLTTGPTGSGKTTTLYACLREIQDESLNIVTVEDPIEYELAGVTQTQVKSDIGVTFATTLRTFLRQDPNVIMVGEIRDEETAALGVRAALTGHLVLSTLHANAAYAAPPRLIEMGIPAHLLGASLRLVLAQRLLRKLCISCRQPLIIIDDPFFSGQAHQPTGCEVCEQTGYRGRFGVYEGLVINETLRGLITRQAPVSELLEIARGQGFITLSERCKVLLRNGDTSLAEVRREAAE